MTSQRHKCWRKKLKIIQIANSVMGLVTSIVWFILFYLACNIIGDIQEYINLIFPVCLFVVSLLGLVITKVRGIKYFYLSVAQSIVNFFVVDLFFTGIGPQKQFLNIYVIFVSVISAEQLLFVLILMLPLVIRARNMKLPNKHE